MTERRPPAVAGLLLDVDAGAGLLGAVGPGGEEEEEEEEVLWDLAERSLQSSRRRHTGSQGGRTGEALGGWSAYCVIPLMVKAVTNFRVTILYHIYQTHQF